MNKSFIIRPIASLGMTAVLTLFSVLTTTFNVLADPGNRTKELSNVAVIGVEQLGEPTHRETFGMIQYLPDPIEGFNRGSLKVTKPVIDWVLKPIAKGWRFLTPEAVRKCVDNFSYNITYPDRVVSLLLEGELKKSGVETKHFLVNTIIGLAGLYDPATSHFEIPTYREDIGQAFAKWGSGPGFYLFIPFLGPSSGRDGLGRIFDTALNPATYVTGLNLFFNLNAFTSRIDGYEALVASEKELYLPVRALWGMQREVAVKDYEIPAEAYRNSNPEPSLGVLALKPSDQDFPGRVKEHRVLLPTTWRKLPYSLWIQEGPAPLVYIIPGIGTHRGSSSPVALAETAFNRGYSVAIVSNPFHWEFITNALSGPYPGFTPSDAEDLYVALSEIYDDVKTRYPEKITSAKLMGYSLGALESLFIAAAQDQRPPGALRFDRFVAINPPVDLRYSARRFDAYFEAPLKWPAPERDEKIKEMAMKAFIVAKNGLPKGKGLPFDRIESEFMVGFSGRGMLLNALSAIKKNGNEVLEIRKEVDGQRGLLLGVINQNNFDRYAADLVIPYYLSKEGETFDSPEALAAAASLPRHEKTLRNAEKIRIFTNANDFILGQEYLEWLQNTVPDDRLTVFPEGGHLGNLHLPQIQRRIFNSLRSAGEEQATIE